jgi:hypothetical protein
MPSGIIGPAIGIALAITLACWRYYKGIPPMTLKSELGHIVTSAAIVAIGGLALGQSFKSVAITLISSILTAAGWNSKSTIPPVAISTPEVVQKVIKCAIDELADTVKDIPSSAPSDEELTPITIKTEIDKK